MIFSYEDFKKNAQDRTMYKFNQFNKLVTFLEELYDVEQLKGLYYRNYPTDKPKQLIFFWPTSILTVDLTEEGYKFEEIKGEVVKKDLIISKHSYRKTNLVLSFGNGESLTFDNIEDSNADWCEDYSIDIKEIYKMV